MQHNRPYIEELREAVQYGYALLKNRDTLDLYFERAEVLSSISSRTTEQEEFLEFIRSFYRVWLVGERVHVRVEPMPDVVKIVAFKWYHETSLRRYIYDLYLKSHVENLDSASFPKK